MVKWVYHYEHRGQSLLEYMLLLILIMGMFLVIQKYIVRGFSGQWKNVGDSWAHGKQYDPEKTTECAFDGRYLDIWYDVKNYEARSCDERCTPRIETSVDEAQEHAKECSCCICESQSAECLEGVSRLDCTPYCF